MLENLAIIAGLVVGVPLGLAFIAGLVFVLLIMGEQARGKNPFQ